MNGTPLVSIISLNYNQPDVTCAFLESTKTLFYSRFEIIVVDNGSKISSAKQIEQKSFPNTRVIVSDKNLGFAGGNNLAMLEAQGDYILLLNNDTEVTPNLIELMIEPFLQDERTGMVSPKIKFYHHPDTIQYAGFEQMNPYTGRSKMIGNKEVDRGQHDALRETYGAHGAAMMVKKQLIKEVGMFSEDYFLYYEEWDWSTRARKAGYKVIYQPKAIVYHKESVTVGKKSPLKAYFHTRNRILYMRRNTEKRQFLVFVLFFTFFSVPKALVKYVSALEFKHAKAFIKGIGWNLRAFFSPAINRS
ncbi:MAG: glycosyltransferase family 2 protein [Tunicatimonas sp.]